MAKLDFSVDNRGSYCQNSHRRRCRYPLLESSRKHYFLSSGALCMNGQSFAISDTY
jgi:hypothetical protein